MYADNPLLSSKLRSQHEQSLKTLAGPGESFIGAERLEMVRVAREALDCHLCAQRKQALSPYALDGIHDGPGELDEVIVEVIHRLRTDPGRITRAWFERVTQNLSQAAYVEIVSVVASSVIIDTLHNALGLGVPKLPEPSRGRPRGQYNKQAVDGGAWVPVLAAAEGSQADGQPLVWNITRALGLVPSALELFFTTFRPHYALRDIPLSISQSQAEFVAARVSAINECFY